jgi:hypothetical protein
LRNLALIENLFHIVQSAQLRAAKSVHRICLEALDQRSGVSIDPQQFMDTSPSKLSQRVIKKDMGSIFYMVALPSDRP